ncbi:hypothetical protein DFH28DRAFT_886444 [Melampsora americana]|nr:hypothetical protein DFH28DRAFT_886444 [Melampsora americana]
MQAFARVADRIYSTTNMAPQPEETPDLMTAGYKKLQEIFKTEYCHNSHSRFCWGSTQAHEVSNVQPENEPANTEAPEGQCSVKIK